jgi:predicted adenine nucleotide alpha hydrolase (AANH) superfamily ATPase
MNEEICCPVCSEPMESLGNISGMYYTSNPVQWDDVYVCREDKTKKTVRKHGQLAPDYSFVKSYEER